METLTVERTIAAPIEDVFAWLSNAHNYTRSKFVLRERLAEPGADAPYGLGALRVLLWTVGIFYERITAYDPPRSFDYHVERSFPPSRHEAGRKSFTEVAGGTHVTWTSTFEIRLPLVGAFLTRVVGVPIIRRVFSRVLDAAQADLTGARIQPH